MQGVREPTHPARPLRDSETQREPVSQRPPERACARVPNVVVLCNAEPFGFGPAASLHAVVEHLQPQLKNVPGLSLQYVGSGLTLALHRPRSLSNPRGYDRVHDIDVYKGGGPEQLKELCETLKPTLFLTVSDAAAASAALGAGVPVVVIDLLLWFWPKVPAPWHGAREVLAADFHGVRERVRNEALSNVTVVPPIAPIVSPAMVPREGVLLNMGGLRNPYIPAAEHIDYANVVNRAARKALALCNIGVASESSLDVIAGPEIVDALGSGQAHTVDPAGTQARMRSTRLVCMTPGLGNLFEASACAQHVLVLPPANDSQGQQMRFLEKSKLLDQAIDWHHLVRIAPIDYDKPQQEVLRDIQGAQKMLLADRRAQGRLARTLYNAMKKSQLDTQGASALRGLVARYGNDGARSMATSIAKTIQEVQISP